MTNIQKLFKSFTYAASGIMHCIKNERNLRVHITCLTYMFSILLSTDWFVLTRTDFAILTVTSSTVIAAEIINTAVENAVNLASEEFTVYGCIAKDAAAGAVLVSAIFAVITGFIILFQPEAFLSMYSYFKENIVMFFTFILSLIPATLFIFWGNPFKKEKSDE